MHSDNPSSRPVVCTLMRSLIYTNGHTPEALRFRLGIKPNNLEIDKLGKLIDHHATARNWDRHIKEIKVLQMSNTATLYPTLPLHTLHCHFIPYIATSHPTLPLHTLHCHFTPYIATSHPTLPHHILHCHIVLLWIDMNRVRGLPILFKQRIRPPPTWPCSGTLTAVQGQGHNKISISYFSAPFSYSYIEIISIPNIATSHPVAVFSYCCRC
jgi:hypothetical protein